jgi:YcaO cyclodehydratase, ATP-ad Mg2+-binding
MRTQKPEAFFLSDVAVSIERTPEDEPDYYVGHAAWRDPELRGISGSGINPSPDRARTIAVAEAVERRAWHYFWAQDLQTIPGRSFGSDNWQSIRLDGLSRSSTGWACHQTYKMALWAATAEYVERVALASFLNGNQLGSRLETKGRYQSIERHDLEVLALGIYASNKVIVAVASVLDPTGVGPSASFGAGSAKTLEEATDKAVREALKIRHWCYRLNSSPGLTSVSAQNALFYARPPGREYLASLMEGGVPPQENQTWSGESNEGDFEDFCKEKGLTEVDLTQTINSPLPVAFVVGNSRLDVQMPTSVLINDEYVPSPFV